MRLFGINTTASLIRQAGSPNDERAITAIAALAKLSPTVETVECLITATSGAKYSATAKSSAAIAALGHIGNPLSTACLIEILSSGSLSAKEAALALGHPRNGCAVDGLRAVVSEHEWYFQVGLALEALAAIGTTEAKLALEQFNRKSARILSVRQPGIRHPGENFEQLAGADPDRG